MLDRACWKGMYEQLLGYLPKGVQWNWPMPPFFTGYSYATLYDWDQYFEALILLYCGFPTDFTRNGIRIFLGEQQADGFIPRLVQVANSIKTSDHEEMVKPFLAQEAILCWHADGQLNWLKGEMYERLKKYIHYWLVKLDVRGEGLSVWRSAYHTGMDNHYSRAGKGSASICEGVDLNCYLVREAQAMALIAEILGYPEDQRYFLECAEKRSQAIQKWLWNDAEGLFYDYHAKESRQIKVKYVGTFAPLWAKVATQDQAGRLAKEHLLNPKEFYRPYPIPALSASEPDYVEGFLPDESTGCCSWRAHTWIPTNYYVFHGLRQYGFLKEAQELAETTLRLFNRGRFSEYYTSESGIGTGLKPFWGWSSLAMFMPLEFESNTNPTDLTSDNPAVSKIRKKINELIC